MLTLIELMNTGTEDDWKDFTSVLEKIKHGFAVATLKQCVLNEATDNVNSVDLRESVAQTDILVQTEGEFVYVTLANLYKRTDVGMIRGLWETTLQRGEMRFEKGEANDYVLQVVLMASDERTGETYSIFAIHPIFASSDGDRDLKLVFKLDTVSFSIDTVSYADIQYETFQRGDSPVYQQNSDFASVFGDDEDEDNNE